MPAPPTPEALKLAHHLLACEAATGRPGEHEGSPVSQIFGKLRQPLGTLAGAAGFQALVSRAVSLAKRDVAWLETLIVGEDGQLDGWMEARAGLTKQEIEKGEVAIVARLLELLLTFVGEAITKRVLGDIWTEGEMTK